MKVLLVLALERIFPVFLLRFLLVGPIMRTIDSDCIGVKASAFLTGRCFFGSICRLNINGGCDQVIVGKPAVGGTVEA